MGGGHCMALSSHVAPALLESYSWKAKLFFFNIVAPVNHICLFLYFLMIPPHFKFVTMEMNGQKANIQVHVRAEHIIIAARVLKLK